LQTSVARLQGVRDRLEPQIILGVQRNLRSELLLWSQSLDDKGKAHTGAGEIFHQVSQLDAPSRPNQIVKHAAWAIALLLSPMSDCDLHSYCELVNQHKQAYTGTS